MIFFLLILFSLYLSSIMILILAFTKVPQFQTRKDLPTVGFSVIIPFRNEAKNLPTLLKSIEELNYPPYLYEVLLVDDDSEDNSLEIIHSFSKKNEISIKTLPNKRQSNSPKKDAITEAINHSKFHWIVTTDADCELPKYWLKTFDAFINEENGKEMEDAPMMICGPVFYSSNRSLFEDFQQIDGFSLMAVGIGSFGLQFPILNNGANLVYRKDVFEKVRGFEGNRHLASGDDIFLMEKIKKNFPQAVRFLKSKEIIVATKPQKTIKGLINQRIRWASKTGKQKNNFSILLGILAIFSNFSFLLLPLALVLDFQNGWYYFVLILSKILIDYMLVLKSADLMGIKINFLKFSFLSFMYPILLIIVLLGSIGGKYSWKGRSFTNQL